MDKKWTIIVAWVILLVIVIGGIWYKGQPKKEASLSPQQEEVIYSNEIFMDSSFPVNTDGMIPATKVDKYSDGTTELD